MNPGERQHRIYHWSYSFPSWLTYAFKSCIMRVLSWFKYDKCLGCLLHTPKAKLQEKKDRALWRLLHFIEKMDVLLMRYTVKLRQCKYDQEEGWNWAWWCYSSFHLIQDEVLTTLNGVTGLQDLILPIHLFISPIHTDLQSRELFKVPTTGPVLLGPTALSSNSKLQLFRNSLSPFSWRPFTLNLWGMCTLLLIVPITNIANISFFQ